MDGRPTPYESMQIDRENKAIELYKQRIETTVSDAVDEILHRLGDGEGGWMREVFEAELVKHCPPRPPVYDPRRDHKITPTRRLRIYKRDGYQCQKCSTNEDLCLDHIVPISKGGVTEDDNLQTLCRTCNLKKGVSTE